MADQSCSLIWTATGLSKVFGAIAGGRLNAQDADGQFAVGVIRVAAAVAAANFAPRINHRFRVETAGAADSSIPLRPLCWLRHVRA